MSAPIEVRVPAEQTEGTRSQVQRWLKSPGEAVRADEPLLELETDKVTVEIAAPAGGTLREILKPEQAEVGPGELLATIDPSHGPGSAARAAAAPPTAEEKAGHPAAAEGAAFARRAGPIDPGAGSRAPSPAVRRLLVERGLTPGDVQGTGEGGRITVDDVLAAPAREAQPGQALPREEATAPRADARFQPHSAMRRRIAERMVESLRIAPHVTSVFEADLAAVLEHRARHRAGFEGRGASLTLSAYFLQACVAAIRAVPEANGRWTDSALLINDAMHIGVATALADGGLVVPVVRHVETLDLFGIARALGDLVTRAREGRLTPADVQGGTFTISNHGVGGSLVATPIVINQPQSAILGIGRLEKRAVVAEEAGGERIVARPRCYVSLTIDHRVMDGARANRFLEVLVRGLEQVSN